MSAIFALLILHYLRHRFFLLRRISLSKITFLLFSLFASSQRSVARQRRSNLQMESSSVSLRLHAWRPSERHSSALRNLFRFAWQFARPSISSMKNNGSTSMKFSPRTSQPCRLPKRSPINVFDKEERRHWFYSVDSTEKVMLIWKRRREGEDERR